MRVWCALLMLLAGAASASAQSSAAEETAIRELWSRFEERFNRRDAAGIAELYAPDGDRISREGEVARGRAEVRKQYEGVFARHRPASAPQPSYTLEIRFLRPDVALLDGEWETEGASGKIRGRFTAVAVKGRGRWWFAAGRDWGAIRQSM